MTRTTRTTRTEIQIYQQKRPAKYLQDHPDERWRCDIFPANQKYRSYHGLGATKAEALVRASMFWQEYEKGQDNNHDDQF